MFKKLKPRSVSSIETVSKLFKREGTTSLPYSLHPAYLSKNILSPSLSKGVYFELSSRLNFLSHRSCETYNQKMKKTQSEDVSLSNSLVNFDNNEDVNSDEDDTALEYDFLYGSIDPKMAEVLIAAGSDLLSLEIDVHSKDELGRTPLHWLAICSENDNHLRTAKLLLENGADVDAVDNAGLKPIDFLKKSLSNARSCELFFKYMTGQENEMTASVDKSDKKTMDSECLENEKMSQEQVQTKRNEIINMFNDIKIQFVDKVLDERRDTAMEKEKWRRFEQTMSDIYEENKDLKIKISCLEANMKEILGKMY